MSCHALPLEVVSERKEAMRFFSQQRFLSTKIHLYPTSNAEIIQPYFFVSCVTSKKERADEKEDTAFP
jgi:hypothetical protein